MDHLLHLPLPLSLQRLHFAVTLFSDTLLSLLSRSDQEAFTSFVKCDGGGVEEVHDKLIKKMNKTSVVVSAARRVVGSTKIASNNNTTDEDASTPETDLPESPTSSSDR